MSNVTQLEQLYKKLTQKKENIITRGHFDLIRVEDLAHQPNSYQRRTYYKISLVFGMSRISYLEKSFDLTGSSLVFTNPSKLYQWNKLGQEQSGYICIFTKEFLDELIDPEEFSVYNSVENSFILLTHQESDRMEAKFQEMSEILASNYARKYDFLRHILSSIIYYGEKNNPPTIKSLKITDANERLAKSFFELLDQQFPVENSARKVMLSSPGQFAEKMGIHVNHLNKVLKEISGKSTSKLVQERLYTEAKSLLKGTHWPIAEIGWLLGFDEANHFSNFFKHHSGMSPKKFRLTD